MTDDLREETITVALRGRWRGPVRFFPVVGSTNEKALAWAENGAPEGSLVVAGHQTAGRGRRGRTWWSEPGRSLLFTMVLRPDRHPAELGLLTTASGVACARAVEEETGIRLGIKWPNDLILGGRKAGGILVESRMTESRVEAAVVGIGINLFDLSEAPVEVAATSTSLSAGLRAIGRDALPTRLDLLVSIVAAFEQLYPALDSESIVAEATERATILGRRVRVVVDGTEIEGRAVSLTRNGMLEVDTGEGRREVGSGELSALEPLTD